MGSTPVIAMQDISILGIIITEALDPWLLDLERVLRSCSYFDAGKTRWTTKVGTCYLDGFSRSI